MKYQITYRTRASNEYLASIIWYKERSDYAAENFIKAINKTVELLSANPYINKNTYKQFYEIRTKIFPFSIVYFIVEPTKRIVIVSIFHHSRNPRKKFSDKD